MSAKQLVKVLVVEDEVVTARAIVRSLEALGYDVIGIADSGEKAIEMAVNTQPDVMLMDIRLKGLVDGVLATRRIQTHLDIPVIYLTALSDEQTLKRVLHSKSYGYIVKPYRDEDLHRAIGNALSRHKMKREAGS
jgi:CheY-like chemotaxis protein